MRRLFICNVSIHAQLVDKGYMYVCTYTHAYMNKVFKYIRTYVHTYKKQLYVYNYTLCRNCINKLAYVCLCMK